MNGRELNIEQIVKDKLKEQKHSLAWLSYELGYDPSNFCKMLKKYDQNTDFLRKISVVLKENLLEFYANSTDKAINGKK
jgi:hypothetical protein